MATRYLTKSRFKLALNCSTILYNTGSHNMPMPLMEMIFLAMLADGGFQIDELVKLIYLVGVEITTKNSDEALIQTTALLQHMT